MKRRVLGALLMMAITSCGWRGEMMEKHGSIGMRFDAGELSLEIPSGWQDTSDYSYANQDESITLRISRLSVTESMSATDLLNDRKHRLTEIGAVKEIQRSEHRIGQITGEWVELEVNRTDTDEDEPDHHLSVHLLVARPSPRAGVVATMTGPLARRAEVDRIWQQILTGLRFR